MRLRWGPYATRLAEQVLIRDPFYVVQVLSEAPANVLADILRNLVTIFDARALTCLCALRPRRSGSLRLSSLDPADRLL